jgi:ammonia channel protein AmtB
MPNIDTGNTGFMLLCSSLVMLMTPGLAFFYGGLVSRRNVLTIMMQSFVSMGWTTVIWFAVGYSLCFLRRRRRRHRQSRHGVPARRDARRRLRRRPAFRCSCTSPIR